MGYHGSGSLVTRTITNSGAGFLDDNGSAPDEMMVSFTLVDEYGAATDAVDATSGHEIAKGYSVTSALDTSGVFSVALWPTDRCTSKEVYYRCRLTRRGLDVMPAVVRPLPSSDLSSLSWADWLDLARWVDLDTVEDTVTASSSFTMTDSAGTTRTLTITLDAFGEPTLQIV